MNCESCTDAATMARILGVARSTFDFFVAEGMFSPVDPEARRNRLYRIGPTAKSYLEYRQTLFMNSFIATRRGARAIEAGTEAGAKLAAGRSWLRGLLEQAAAERPPWRPEPDPFEERLFSFAIEAARSLACIREEMDAAMAEAPDAAGAVEEAAQVMRAYLREVEEGYYYAPELHPRRAEFEELAAAV